MVDGKLLPIRRSLHEFLVELRLLDRPRTVWADAICINQGDVVERNAQVALMRDIYSTAQTVLVWLGPHDVGSPHPFDSFKLVAAKPAFVQTGGSLDWNENIFQAFDNLISRPYWRRTWIIQEIVLANNIRLFSGDASIPWLDFVAMYKTCFPESTTSSQLRSPLLELGSERLSAVLTEKSRKTNCRVETLDMLIHVRKRDAQPLLMEMMDWNHPYECFDFRDRVYGVLGFVADGACFLSLVNYNCSAEELFLSILKVLNLHMDCFLYKFITRIHTLARRIGLDLVRFHDFSKAFRTSTRFGAFDPGVSSSHIGHGFPSFSRVFRKMESQLQLKSTSQMLRKYQGFESDTSGRDEVIAKAKLLPDDWLIFLCSGDTRIDSPDVFLRGQGLYGIYRQYRLVDYCVLIKSHKFIVRASYERAAYDFLIMKSYALKKKSRV